MKPMQFSQGNHRIIVTNYLYSRQLTLPADKATPPPQLLDLLWLRMLDVSNWRHWLPGAVAATAVGDEDFGRGSIVEVDCGRLVDH